ncbi:hypothetical protein Tco_0875138 [Tanacetum coccineum]|uniref:Xylulose kinase-1 n=1 Tax=Tanacetum coccineum TaxID=301880 RepID=A0ABQ5BRF6_9ASTR
MAALTFADTHNMVAFLEKPAESDGFYEIIDFLNANQIHYALTINPTIYTSCIEQFWATAKTAQAEEITNLNMRVKRLKKKAGLRTHKIPYTVHVVVIKEVEYSNEESLVDETQGRTDDVEMFDTDALIGNEVFAENDMIEKDQDVIPKKISTAAPSTTAVPPPVITEVEITLAQTLAKLKSAKSKDAGESTTRTPTLVSSSSIKDKWKAKIDEPEVPLKKKDQIDLDEEMARNLEAQIQAKVIEEERLTRKKEEEPTIALIESWDNRQAMMEADYPEVVKSKEGTEKSSKRTEDEIESDKSKKSESNDKKAKGNRKKSIGKKRKRNEQKQESSKRQRMEDDKETDEHEEAKEDDEAEMKKHMKVVQDDEEITIDVIPLATKPPIIVEYKIVKEGQKGFYHLIRDDGSSNRYSS